MLCQQATLSGDAEWPKVADAVIEAGALTQLSGPAGCVADIGDGVTCTDGRGLDGAVTIVVSPDGQHVYVASRGGAVAVFTRNGTTGVLTQLSGAAGCIDETGVTGCTVGKALGGLRAITISPDGKHVYVGARDANAVAAFARDATTGVGCRKF
jgi:DNA-binding beta-propeller fold protein YncE